MQSESLLFVLGGFGSVLFGIAVLVATQLVAGPRDFSRDDILRTILSVAGWVLITIGLLANFFFLFSAAGLLLPIIAAIVLVEALVRRRQAQQHSLLWVMTAAAERFIPLVPAIEAFGHERGGVFAWRARNLAARLSAGVTLPEALRRSPGLLPPGVLPIILVGYESGALAPALRQAASTPDLPGQMWQSLAGKLMYLCGLMLFGVATVTAMMIWIIPSFIAIFSDFDVELPEMTQMLISGSQFFNLYGFLLSPLFGATFLLFFYAVLRYANLIRWELPGVNRLVRRLDTAAILDALALAAQHQRPLPEAIASLARSYPKAAIRGRLRRVLRDLETGADWCESLRARDLIGRADRAILRAAQRVGNLPWALSEMADSNRRRLAYRLQALMQLVFPPVILAVGALVMFFVVALFVPLVSLIQSLT